MEWSQTTSFTEKMQAFRITQAKNTMDGLLELRKQGLLSSIDDESFADLLIEAQHGGEVMEKVREFIARHASRRIGE